MTEMKVNFNELIYKCSKEHYALIKVCKSIGFFFLGRGAQKTTVLEDYYSPM